MTEIELAIGRSKYHIQCQESQKEKLLEAATKLNEVVNKLSFSFREIDEKTLLVIAALTIQSELLGKTDNNKNSTDENKIHERDVYDAVSESMENVTSFVEKLTKKIQNY